MPYLTTKPGKLHKWLRRIGIVFFTDSNGNGLYLKVGRNRTRRVIKSRRNIN